MWDIIDYKDDSICLILRGLDGGYDFRYPWSAPTPCVAELPDDVRPEQINVPSEDLFEAVTVRAQVSAIAHLSKLSRGELGGGIARSIAEAHEKSLEFAIRRIKKRLISTSDFAAMLRSAAIIDKIPNEFWDRVDNMQRFKGVDRLKNTMDALSVFNRRSATDGLDGIYEYLSRTVWFSNDFARVQLVAKAMSIFYKGHIMGAEFGALADRAGGMLKKLEIESERDTVKPWQKSVPSKARQVRVGPAASKSKPRDVTETEGGCEE